MQGVALAQKHLGDRYYSGEGVAQSLERAAHWWKQAAENGNARAQCNLATCYYNGSGVEQSEESAIAWWKAAAKQGHSGAQHSLGQILGEERAAEWRRRGD